MPGRLAASSIVVSWNSPMLTHQNGIITKYKILYFLTAINNATNNTIVLLGNVTRHTIYDLKPSSNYSIQVAAATSVGFGPYHEQIIHLTDPAGEAILFQKLNTNIVIAIVIDYI